MPKIKNRNGEPVVALNIELSSPIGLQLQETSLSTKLTKRQIVSQALDAWFYKEQHEDTAQVDDNIKYSTMPASYIAKLSTTPTPYSRPVVITITLDDFARLQLTAQKNHWPSLEEMLSDRISYRPPHRPTLHEKSDCFNS